MDEALWLLLSGSVSITEMIADRLYWDVAAQGVEAPYLVLGIIGGADTPHLGGTDGLWRYRVQIDSYGKDRPGARALSRAVSDLLNGYRGDGFRGVFIDATRSDFEGAAAGRPSRISQDFIIHWRG